jgi:hypothetical protein
MKPRDLDARLAWSRKRLRQRQRKPLARHAGETWDQATDKTQARPVAPCAPCGAADDPSEGV